MPCHGVNASGVRDRKASRMPPVLACRFIRSGSSTANTHKTVPRHIPRLAGSSGRRRWPFSPGVGESHKGARPPESAKKKKRHKTKKPLLGEVSFSTLHVHVALEGCWWQLGWSCPKKKEEEKKFVSRTRTASMGAAIAARGLELSSSAIFMIARIVRHCLRSVPSMGLDGNGNEDANDVDSIE